MKKILFIVNQNSGGKKGKSISSDIRSALTDYLSCDTYDIREINKSLNDDIEKLAKQHDRLIIAGGDGSVFHAINNIADLDKSPALGIIPLGTGNDLARSLGYYNFIKKNGMKNFIQKLTCSEITDIDSFSINDNLYFTNYFSIGIDAKISNEFNNIRKKCPNFLFCSKISNFVAYIILGLKNIIFPEKLNLKIESPNGFTKTINEKIPGIILSNINSYAAGNRLSSKSDPNDSCFEFTIIRKRINFIKLMFTALSGKSLDKISGVEQIKATDIRITSENAELFIQADGENLTGKICPPINIKFFKAFPFIKI